MLKLLLCMLCATACAMALLELRQQRLHLVYETDKLHNQVQATQAQLWNQQLAIAQATAPAAVAAVVRDKSLKLDVPETGIGHHPWVEDPDAAE